MQNTGRSVMSIWEKWIHDKWRPTIGWLYAVILFSDILLMPYVWITFQYLAGQEITAWTPVTYANGGMFHTTMVGIVGVAVAGRTYEKVKGVATDTKQ